MISTRLLMMIWPHPCSSSSSSSSGVLSGLILMRYMHSRVHLARSLVPRICFQRKPIVLNEFVLNQGRSLSTSVDARATSSGRSLVVVPLTQRGLLAVEGESATKFLQGMVTQHIPVIEHTHQGIYTSFLTSQGRILCDAFIYSTSTERASYIIECDALALSVLEQHLRRYKLRSAFQLSVASDQATVLAMWDDAETSLCAAPFVDSHHDSAPSVLLSSCLDTRHPHMGSRLLVRNTAEAWRDLPLLRSSVSINTMEQYTMRRMQLGVPEGVVDLGVAESIPLEANLDLMGGIHFHKGCYLGQELVARTHFTGVIRKRILPVRVKRAETGHPSPDGEESLAWPQPGSDIVDSQGKSIGKVRSALKGVGLAMLRLEHASKLDDQGHRLWYQAVPFGTEVPRLTNGWQVQAVWPSWWPQDTWRP